MKNSKSLLLRPYIIFFALILILFLSGCSEDSSDSQYIVSAKEFNSTYFEIVECIDSRDTLKSLRQLQNEENTEKLEQIKDLLKDIKQNIPKDREQIFHTFELRYNDLVFLKESYSKFESLTEDDRGKIDTIFISIDMDKENWKDKKSSIKWY